MMSPFEKATLSRLCRSPREVRMVLRTARRWRAQGMEQRDLSKIRLWRIENGRRKEPLDLALAFWLLTVGYERPAYALFGPIAACALFAAGFGMMIKHWLG
jgi:transcriptional regulator with XRE-family HTH domain